MANDKTIVDFEAMQRAAGVFENTVGELQNIEKNMENSIVTLEVGWTGEAAGQFNQVLRSWQNKFNDITGLLENMRVTLQGNNKAYQNNEQDNVAATTNLYASM